MLEHRSGTHERRAEAEHVLSDALEAILVSRGLIRLSLDGAT